MKRYTVWFLGVLGLLICTVIGFYFFGPRPEIHVTDRLCDFVRNDEKMDCVAVLASDTYVRPGAIVDYTPGRKPGRVPLPVADLFRADATCYIPGVQIENIQRDLQQAQAISVPTFTYDVDRSLVVGGDVEVPRLEDATLTAGPKWSDISKIELSTDEAWVINVDENLALAAVRDCKIRKTCVDRILSQKYSVVETTIVAKGLGYKLYAKDGRLLSLQGGLTSGEFSVKSGATSNFSSTIDATVKAQQPRVLGVRLMKPDVFNNQAVCTDVVIFSTDGWSKVGIKGSGYSGNIGSLRSEFRPLGTQAAISARGSESSDCDNGLDRVLSFANADAAVTSSESGVLNLQYNIQAHGSHYVNAHNCFRGHVIGKTGRDTVADASVRQPNTLTPSH